MGEILIDFIPIDEQGETVGFRMHPGGSPFNVAVGLARLGQHTAFVSRLARDFFGRYLHAHLESQGIATSLLCYDEQAQSTLAFVALEDGEPVYSFYDQGAADTLLTIDDIPAACLEETRILHFGSISLLRGTTPSAVVATVEKLKGRALLSFDPNVRPALIRDEPAYRHLIGRLVALSDIVKLSAADIDWLAPAQPYEQVASNMLAQGAALVVVTRGNMGALVLRATPDGTPQRWDVPAFVVPTADTVGAGDAFSAGLLAALAERAVSVRAALLQLDVEELERVLHFASAVSAVTCMRAGADPPTRAEVEQFLHGL
jgi:fructokinase